MARINAPFDADLDRDAPLSAPEAPEPPRTCGGCEWCVGILLRAGGFIRACCADPLAMEEVFERDEACAEFAPRSM